MQLSFASVNGFTPSYAVGIGARGTELSILALLPCAAVGFYLCGQALLTIRWGERNVLIWSIVLFAGAVMVIPLCTTMGMLYFTQTVGAIGRGTIALLMTLMIKKWLWNTGLQPGFYQSIYALGMTLGPVVMGMIGDALGLRLGFSLLGVLGMVTRV